MFKILFFLLILAAAIVAPIYFQHDFDAQEIPGRAPWGEFDFFVEQRKRDRESKSFGSHPDAREPQHPYTAKAGSAGIHADAAASDVHLSGPTGDTRNMQVVTRAGSKFPGGMCATITFNKRGFLIALCASLRRFELHMFEPRTLRLLAMFPLPNRPSTWAMLMTLDPTKMMLDTSGGAYYYLDNEDRVVLGDANQHIRRIGHRQIKDGDEAFKSNNPDDSPEPVSGYFDGQPPMFEFYDVNDWDVSFMIPTDCMTYNNWFPSKDPEACDPITAVIPDFDGNIWFVTRRGIIGVLDPTIGKVVAKTHLHEEMQNGLTAGEDGVWIVTDKALYVVRLVKSSDNKNNNNNNNNKKKKKAETDGIDGSFEIDVLWKTSYDRGSYRKVGMLSVGSGTTPTLFDGRFVTITDNNDDQINLLVYDLKDIKLKKRTGLISNNKNDNKMLDAPLVCTMPLFEKNQSASDNSMIAVDGSIFMENNCGYHNAIQQRHWSRKQLPGGVVRVDLEFESKKVAHAERKVTGCKKKWEIGIRAPSCVAKLGSHTALLYYYTLLDDPEIEQQEEEEFLRTGGKGEGAVGGVLSTVSWMLGLKSEQKKEPLWGLTAVDAHTGEVVFVVPTGRGRNYDNNWGPVTLGPDGTAYVGVIKGIVSVFDDQ